VLDLYGIDSLAIDGTMAFHKRDEVVSKFHAPGSARVFIFSSVGSAGLNLSIADVVIFFVRRVSFFDILMFVHRISFSIRLSPGARKTNARFEDGPTVNRRKTPSKPSTSWLATPPTC
jgi:predicted helicase